MIGFFIGLFLGAWMGFIAAGLMVSASRYMDEQEEIEDNDNI